MKFSSVSYLCGKGRRVKYFVSRYSLCVFCFCCWLTKRQPDLTKGANWITAFFYFIFLACAVVQCSSHLCQMFTAEDEPTLRLCMDMQMSCTFPFCCCQSYTDEDRPTSPIRLRMNRRLALFRSVAVKAPQPRTNQRHRLDCAWTDILHFSVLLLSKLHRWGRTNIND